MKLLFQPPRSKKKVFSIGGKMHTCIQTRIHGRAGQDRSTNEQFIHGKYGDERKEKLEFSSPVDQ